MSFINSVYATGGDVFWYSKSADVAVSDNGSDESKDASIAQRTFSPVEDV